MLATKITICFLILYNFGIAYGLKLRYFTTTKSILYVVSESCSDCVEISLCPDVRKWPQEGLGEKLVESLCGKKETADGTRSIMICCSDFAMNLTNCLTVRLDESVETENDIDNHPNIGLLPKNCGKHFDIRIVGGKFTGIYEFPWMALISHVVKDFNGKKVNQFKCGGTIISSRHILTAAHCVHEGTIAFIRLGEYNTRKRTDCQGAWPNYVCESHLQEVHVEKATVHEEYNISQKGINDIAIIRVNNDINFSFKNVRPICLPVWEELRKLNLSGKNATVAGWGITETGKQSNILRKVTVPIMAEADCAEFLRRNSCAENHTLKNFCAGEVEKDSCNGDSGGPLMLFEEYKDNYRMIQYGIVSYGSVQCGSNKPGVYTDVTKYMKWILDNLE